MTAAGLFAPLRGGFPPGRGRAGVALAGGEGFPPVRGAFARPDGRGGVATSDGWFIAPPIFSFHSRNEKRKRAVHGPKEKSKGTRLRGGGTVPAV